MISSKFRIFLAVVTLVLMVPAFAGSEPLIFTDA